MAEEAGTSPELGEPEGGGPGEIRREEEPGTGTLFIMLVFLMALAAMWAIMYLTLLER
jgi:hypothetical protein